MSKSEIIYLDNNATTKVDPRVLEEMIPFLTEYYANASSTNPFGLKAYDAVNSARYKVAELIGSSPNEITFTSGATEAINLAVKSIVENHSIKGKHVITIETEHSAVLKSLSSIKQHGFEITTLPVESDGFIDLNLFKNSLREDTVLACVMYVNNETGVILPIKEITEICHNNGTFILTDATQAVGKIDVNVKELGVDLLCVSAHKFYGPKGIGALYHKAKGPFRVQLSPLIFGGGQEKGFRSGTLNVPGIVGFGKASEIAKNEFLENNKKIKVLRDLLETELLKINDTFLNGNKEMRVSNVTNICFKGADADAIMIGLKNIVISKGSACNSDLYTPSHVLKAMGLSDDDAFSSIRFSIGKYNTKEEVIDVIKSIRMEVEKLRNMINK